MPSLSPAWRMSAVFAATNVTNGVFLPFFPLFLVHRGLTDSEIAVVLAVPIVLRVFTAPFLGLLADTLRDRRTAIAVYALGAAIAFAAMINAAGFATILFVVALTALPWNGVAPVMESVAMGIDRRGQGDYGRMRLWASVAFVASNLACGMALGYGDAGMVLWLLLGAFWLQAIAAPFTPRLAGDLPIRSGSPGALRLRDLVSDRKLVMVLGGIALIQSTHGLAYGFASLLWGAQGFGQAAIGSFWAIGTLSEIVLFVWAAPVARRLGPIRLILVGGVAAALRWIGFGLVDDAGAWVVVQCLHALSFGATHIGTIVYVTRATPERLASSAQGLIVTISGVAMTLATLAAGPLYGALGAAAFPIMSVVACIGILIVLLAVRVQPQSAAAGGKTVDPS